MSYKDLEEATFAPEHAPGYLQDVGERRFFARNEGERKMLLHAFAHIPAKAAKTDAFEKTKPRVDDDQTLTWVWSWRNIDAYGRTIEPELGGVAVGGHVAVTYHPGTKLFAVRVIWREWTPERAPDDLASTGAVGLRSRLEVSKLLSAARALGLASWGCERARIARERERRRQREDAVREKTMAEMP